MQTTRFRIHDARCVRRLSAGALPFLSLLLATESGFAQGLNGFMPDPHHVTIALSHTLESYDEFWMGTREVSDPTLGEIETGSVSLFVDVGVCRNVAVTANLAYVDAASDAPAPLAASGLQDRTFLLRYRFLQMGSSLRHAFVAGAGVRAPMAHYEPNRAVALGDETTDALFRLVYQIEGDFLDGTYLAAEFGYDLREDDTPDGMSIFGELGATIGRVSPSVSILRTLADDGFDIGDPGFTFPGLEGEMLRVGAKLYYRVSPTFGLAVSGFATPDGRNVGKAIGTSTSLVVQL